MIPNQWKHEKHESKLTTITMYSTYLKQANSLFGRFNHVLLDLIVTKAKLRQNIRRKIYIHAVKVIQAGIKFTYEIKSTAIVRTIKIKDRMYSDDIVQHFDITAGIFYFFHSSSCHRKGHHWLTIPTYQNLSVNLEQQQRIVVITKLMVWVIYQALMQCYDCDEHLQLCI